MPPSVLEFLDSPDPLSNEAVVAVLAAREENSIIDYKVDFDGSDEHWLEITKDVMALANTLGGYLAFGIRNGTFEIVGLNDEAIRLLSEPNVLLLKLNRFVEPSFTTVRSKLVCVEGKSCVVIHVPASHGHTHIVARDGSFRHPTGTPKVVLRQGTFYVRRSGANHLGNARDLDAIVARRIEYFRSSLMGKIARVVEAPADSEILVVKQEGDSGTQKRFVIEDAPDAISVKGLSFTVAPETPEQEIAAWIAISGKNKRELPSAGLVWKWYSQREVLRLSANQKVRVAAIALLRRVPPFYWLRECKASEAKRMLSEILELDRDPEVLSSVLAVSAFLGRRFHKSQVTKLGAAAKRLGKTTVFPTQGPREYFESSLIIRRLNRGAAMSEARSGLERILLSASEAFDGRPALADQWHAARLDCFLYAQDDYAGETGDEPEGKNQQSK